MNHRKKINIDDVLRSIPNSVCETLDYGESNYCEYCGGFLGDPISEVYGFPADSSTPKCMCREPAE